MVIFKKLAALLISPVLFVGFLVATDPYKLPLPLLIVPFVLFAAMVYMYSRLALRTLHVSRRRARLIAVIISGLLLLVALLQSIRQLSLKDFLILSALVIGLTIYARRLDI